MRDLGRFWWVEALLSLPAVAVAIVVPILSLSQLLPLDQELGNSILPDIALAAGASLFAAFVAAYLGIDAERTRRRQWRRWAALRGNLDAIPSSRIVPNPAKAPDVSVEPLVLLWRARKWLRYVVVPLLIIVGTGMAVVAGACVYIGILIFTPSRTPLPFWLQLVGAGVVLIVLAGIIALGIFAAQLLPGVFGRPFGITANADGIESRPQSGAKRFMAWQEMRLLEVGTSGSGSSRLSPRAYRIYDARGRNIEWIDRPGSTGDVEPLGIPSEEMTLRLNALLDLINARTGLVPRTFSKALQVPKEGSDQAAGVQTALRLLIMAAVTLGAAAATIALPLTTVSVLNMVVAGSLAILALVIILSVVWSLVGRAFRSEATGPVQAPVANAPPLDSPGTVYALRHTIPPWTRLQFAAGGILLLPNVVPVLLVWGSGLLSQFVSSGSLPQVPNPLGVVLAYLLGIYGLGGLFLLVLALWLRSYTVRADQRGLSFGSGRLSTFLPWDGIERIVGHTRGGRVIAYEVTGDAGRTQLGWSAQPTRFRRIAPEPGALPITPDEMAALVARQSGQPLQIERAR